MPPQPGLPNSKETWKRASEAPRKAKEGEIPWHQRLKNGNFLNSEFYRVAENPIFRDTDRRSTIDTISITVRNTNYLSVFRTERRGDKRCG